MPSDWNALVIALVFVVPGFIMISTLNSVLPRRRATGGELFVYCLTASAYNFALWFWLIYWMIESGTSESNPFLMGILLTVVTLISPIAAGLLIANFSQRKVPARVLSTLGFHPLHPTPTAWDYQFHRMIRPERVPSWAIITLKNDRTVCGRWGKDSFASSDPGNRDIYLESVWRIDEMGKWTEVPQSDGIIVPCDQIAHIEFWNNNPTENHDE